MQDNFSKIDELSAALKKLLPMKPEFQTKLDKKFRLEFNYNSNHMEGNTLTYSETELLLIFDETKGSHTLREYEEMKAHDVALRLVKEWAADKERPLTEINIKNLNETILVKPFWKEAVTPDGQKTRRLIKVGDYKEFPNSVLLSNGEVFEYASVTDTPILMRELIDWYRAEEKSVHPVTLAAMLHYKFVRIHPFDDGNGRIARLLMNYVLFKSGFPSVIIKSDDKKNYLSALRIADTGEYEPLITYICEQLIWSLELSIKAAKGKNISEPGDLEKKLNLLKQQLESSTDDEVKKEKTNEITVAIFNSDIKPLFKEVISRLQQFESLFKSRTIQVLMGSQGHSNINEVLKDEYIPTELRNGHTNIQLQYSLNGFRKAGVKTFNVSINLNIRFHQFVYELARDNNSVIISKLYHQHLTDDEMKTVSEILGNQLLENIEATLGNINRK